MIKIMYTLVIFKLIYQLVTAVSFKTLMYNIQNVLDTDTSIIAFN